MNLSLYVDAGSTVHGLDPRTKLAASALMCGICLCFNHPLYIAAVALALTGVSVWSGTAGNLWRVRYLLGLLMLFSSLLWPFFVEGPTELWAWGGMRVSRESILYGMAMGIRLVAFVATGILLISTTRMEELTSGLIRLGLPHPAAFALTTALRLVPTFVGTGAAIIEAQMARGLDLESGNVLQRLKKFIPQAVPLFICAVRHTHHLAMALESRGFDPGAERTLFYEPRMRPGDWVVLSAMGLLFVAALAVRLVASQGSVLPGRL
jgi:energy-coupling factor transport system permease protein